MEVFGILVEVELSKFVHLCQWSAGDALMDKQTYRKLPSRLDFGHVKRIKS